MIGVFIKITLILFAANSSRLNGKRRLRHSQLQKRAEDLQQEEERLRKQIQSFPAREKHAMDKMEKAWEVRLKKVEEETRALKEALQKQISVLEGQLRALKAQEAWRTSLRIRELEGILSALGQKLSRRDATITEMEKELEAKMEKEAEGNVEKEDEGHVEKGKEEIC